jgi:hypothetical protein
MSAKGLDLASSLRVQASLSPTVTNLSLDLRDEFKVPMKPTYDSASLSLTACVAFPSRLNLASIQQKKPAHSV